VSGKATAKIELREFLVRRKFARIVLLVPGERESVLPERGCMFLNEHFQVNGLRKVIWKEGGGRERASYESASLLLGMRNWGGGAIGWGREEGRKRIKVISGANMREEFKMTKTE
jgi:hypothetical protein